MRQELIPLAQAIWEVGIVSKKIEPLPSIFTPDEVAEFVEFEIAFKEEIRKFQESRDFRNLYQEFIADGVVTEEEAVTMKQRFIEDEFKRVVEALQKTPESKHLEMKKKILKAQYQQFITPGSITDVEIRRASESPMENFIKLKGRMAHCPFHTDKTPSLHVTRNLWKCHSCGEGGDTIEFIKKTEKLSFIQAVKYILNL